MLRLVQRSQWKNQHRQCLLYERGKTGRRQVHESFSIYLNSDYRLDTAWREIWVMRVALLQPDLLAVKLKNTKL